MTELLDQIGETLLTVQMHETVSEGIGDAEIHLAAALRQPDYRTLTKT